LIYLIITEKEGKKRKTVSTATFVNKSFT